jgi:hypothetical protein
MPKQALTAIAFTVALIVALMMSMDPTFATQKKGKKGGSMTYQKAMQICRSRGMADKQLAFCAQRVMENNR